MERAPSLKTYMFNGLLQTPFPIGGVQPTRRPAEASTTST